MTDEQIITRLKTQDGSYTASTWMEFYKLCDEWRGTPYTSTTGRIICFDVDFYGSRIYPPRIENKPKRTPRQIYPDNEL